MRILYLAPLNKTFHVFTSRWLQGRSADRKKTFGVCNLCDRLDSVPADSQGAACLLCMHSSQHTTVFESMTLVKWVTTRSHIDWYTQKTNYCTSETLLRFLCKSMSHCLVITHSIPGCFLLKDILWKVKLMCNLCWVAHLDTSRILRKPQDGLTGGDKYRNRIFRYTTSVFFLQCTSHLMFPLVSNTFSPQAANHRNSTDPGL